MQNSQSNNKTDTRAGDIILFLMLSIITIIIII